MSATFPDLSIKLFGQLEAFDASGKFVTFPSRRAGWLLSVLALADGNPIERRYLASSLWPDSSDAGALHNLRQTLALLRRALGSAGDCICSAPTRSIYLTNSRRIAVDVWDFDRDAAEMTPDALERAIATYRAPLLAECDEPFALSAREARERTYLGVAESLAAHYISQRNHAKAIDLLRRASEVDPYRESIDRSLMQVLVATGETAAAIDVFRTLRRRLRQDLGSDPDPETIAVFKSIKTRTQTRIAPQPKSAPRVRRLPTPISALLGRDAEIREVASLLERCRLVTLAGVGGVGKTRLAIAVAESVEDRYLDGARFVDLSLLTAGASIPFAIANTLDFESQVSQGGLQVVADQLANMELLLVLDNCEHLIETVSQVLEAILTAAPKLSVLVTSRQSVGVVGELVWRVPSLATPDSFLEGPTVDRPEGASRLSTFPSVSLFLERSGQSEVTSLELATIGAICRRLDGIPLAIELAAARARVLSVAQIEARLENQFALLAGGSQSPARHRTIRATIEWSWDLLADDERAMMKRLSVFRGGCTLEAAEAALGQASSGGPALDLIASLVDRSLIVSTQSAFGSRFTMLESIRRFATEQIADAEELDTVHRAHRDYFLQLAEGIKGKLTGLEQNRWFQVLELEHDNLRAALTWSHACGEHELGLRLAVALSRFWDTHGHLGEGRILLEASLEQAESQAPSRLLANARVCAGWIATVQVDCIAARKHYEKALPYFRGIGDDASIAKILNCLGTANSYAGDLDIAQPHFEEALALYESLGMRGQVATVLSNLGDLSLCRNDTVAARAYLERSLMEDRAPVARSPENRGLTVGNLSILEFRDGNYERARANAIGAVQMFAECEAVVLIPEALCQLAIATTAFEEWERVATLLGAADALAPLYGVTVPNLIADARVAAIEGAQSELGPEAYQSAFERGRVMSVGDSIAFALG